MIYDRTIRIPVISPFNWEGFFTDEQYRNIENEYIPSYHNTDVVYLQFRSLVARSFKLRIRDCYNTEIATFDYNARTLGLAQYKYLYDLYLPLDYANGYYYFEIYVESENKSYADTEPISISDECLNEIGIEGFNDIDKDSHIYTENTVQMVETNSTVGSATITLLGENLTLAVEAALNTYTVELEKDINYDYEATDSYAFYRGGTLYNYVTIPKGVDNIPYRAIIKDGDATIAYSEWFCVKPNYTEVAGELTASYDLYAQKRVFFRVEANFRPDENKLTSTKKRFTEQDQDTRTTSSIEGEIDTLTIGWIGIPRWLKQKMNRLLGLNHIYINEIEYSVVSDIEEKTEEQNLESGFYILKVDLQRTIHKEYSDNVYGAILVNETMNPLANEDNKYLQT